VLKKFYRRNVSVTDWVKNEKYRIIMLNLSKSLKQDAYLRYYT
jgi:hypothetical protein